MRKPRFLPVQLLPRFTLFPLLAVAASYVCSVVFPYAFLAINTGSSYLAREVPGYEWMPVATALILAVCLAPRLHHLERCGTRRVAAMEVAFTSATIALPTILSFCSMHTLAAVLHMPVGPMFEFPTNVLVMSSLIVALVGLLGPAFGSVAGAGLYLLLIWMQGLPIDTWQVLPLTAGMRPIGYDTSLRWGWMIAAPILAVAIAAWRRNLPVQVLRATRNR